MTSTSSSAAAAASNLKICFNSQCIKDSKSESQRRKGWRLRSGDHAELCDRCACAYEQGTFCETFHSEAAGWRKCESCGKRVHCGCIVSAQSYLLLDAGGIECVVCARKALSMAPNNMWSTSLLISPQVSERPKELPVKSWGPVTGSYPGQWRQGPHLWSTGIQSDLQQRLSYEFDRPLHTDRLIAGVRASMPSQEKKVGETSERVAGSNLNHVARNGTTGLDSALAFSMHRDEGNNLQDSCHHIGNSDRSTGFAGVNFEAHPNSCGKPLLKGESSPLLVGLATNFSSTNNSSDPGRVSMTQSQRQMALPLQKQLPLNSHSTNDTSVDARAGRSRVDARAQAHLLTRYRPRITDQELQQISGDSNSVITPLFEKILSASDAGRIGRLVLPKKCAEAYFPTISHPEGLPLKVQDASGKEWGFQFRFWPNNNSRMYVLEGVTPCIQSMQLQAGDTVTFSRIDPEGKLVMGFRKASNVSSDQDTQTVKTGNGLSTPPEGNENAADFNMNVPLRPSKGCTDSRNPANAADQATLSKLDKTGFIQKDGNKSSHGSSKRKSSSLGSKNKRLRIENEDSIELKITWEEAQELLRPPPSDIPTIVVIDGHEIEEYEEAPILGKPTIFTTNQAGENNQWAQCEDCSKWRKLPVDALLPSRWTCSENKWDPERSSCSSSQETSMELTNVLPKTGSRKPKAVKVENNDNLEVVSDGLDTLANLAILGEGDCLPASASQATTKHPRHRPGCSCIVCIQPPSGKGPKHKQTCMCNVCLTVKRRFRTLMLRREQRQSEKEAETIVGAHKQTPLDQSPEMLLSGGGNVSSSPQSPAMNNEGEVVDDSEKRVTVPSPLKAQIDLNIQPEREEEPSPKADGGSVTRPFVADGAA